MPDWGSVLALGLQAMWCHRLGFIKGTVALPGQETEAEAGGPAPVQPLRLWPCHCGLGQCD